MAFEIAFCCFSSDSTAFLHVALNSMFYPLLCALFALKPYDYGQAGMTNVAQVRFLESASYVG